MDSDGVSVVPGNRCFSLFPMVLVSACWLLSHPLAQRLFQQPDCPSQLRFLAGHLSEPVLCLASRRDCIRGLVETR